MDEPFGAQVLTMLREQIRSALPGILTGMRISMAGAWTHF